MYKYELVTDLDNNGIAKAMIDGEVFYSRSGNISYAWDGRSFVQNTLGYFFVQGDFYRKVKLDWKDKLEGTLENAVLCWVSDTKGLPHYEYAVTVKAYHQVSLNCYQHCDVAGRFWKYATPLTKEELQTFMDKAPE